MARDFHDPAVKGSREMSEHLSERKILWSLFLAAIAVRWAYATILFLAYGDNGLMVGDSFGYMNAARRLATALASGEPLGWTWLGTDVSVMPLITWLWTASIGIFGNFAAPGFVLFQGMVDAGTCLFIYGIAKTLRSDFALPAGIFAAVNPTQIVLAGLFYTDTVFLFFSTLVLFATLRWMQAPSLRIAALAGLAVGAAALTRLLILPWAACLLGLLFFIAVWRKQPVIRCLRDLAAGAAVAALCIAPIVARNVMKYDAWAMTAQTGAYYAFWIAPLVKQAKDGTPWEKGAEEMAQREAKLPPLVGENPFEFSRRQTELGKEALRELGMPAVAKAWLFGAALNLGSPAVMISPPVLRLPRTGFYATPGETPVQKVFNFLFRSDNTLYAWTVLIGIVGVAAIRLLQIAGLGALLLRPENLPGVMLLGSWVAYILLVNGPIASPKYRLPIEQVFAVLSAAGYCTLKGRMARRRG
jgi:4-amino-4-deoxy-L-arabinose transferase-like glycosyltransferase